MKAAVHLGKHYAETLGAVRNTDFSDAESCLRSNNLKFNGVNTVEKYFGTRTCCYIVDSEIERLFGIGAAPWRQSSGIP